MTESATRQMSRRAVLGGMGTVLAAPALGMDAGAVPLWRAAAACGMLFGAAGNAEVLSDPGYATLHTRHSKLYAFENGMKFDFLHPHEPAPDYGPVEGVLGYCEKNGLMAQGTALIWNDWVPAWLRNRSGAEVARAMDAHLERTAARFYGRFHSYGVVNEPFWPDHGKPGGYRNGPFLEAMGEDYIFRAFKRVAAVDPTTKLMLNEAFCEHDDALGIKVRANLLTLIDKMLDRGLKLDAVGLETHLRPGEAQDIEAYARFLEEIAKRKLRIWFTEFDIDDQRFAREQTKRDEQIAAYTSDFLKVALENRAVDVFIAWGLADKFSWYRDPAFKSLRKRDFPARPLPFDDNYREKPITRAMRAAFLAAPQRA